MEQQLSALKLRPQLEIEGIELAARAVGIKELGSPIGNVLFVAAFMKKKVERINMLMDLIYEMVI